MHFFHEASATRHLGAVNRPNHPSAVLGQSRQLGYFKLVLSHFEMFFLNFVTVLGTESMPCGGIRSAQAKGLL